MSSNKKTPTNPPENARQHDVAWSFPADLPTLCHWTTPLPRSDNTIKKKDENNKIQKDLDVVGNNGVIVEN